MTTIEIVLIVLLVGTNAGWMYFVHQLINKLMSRNFGDYVQAAASVKGEVHRVKLPDEPEEDLGALKGIFGAPQ